MPPSTLILLEKSLRKNEIAAAINRFPLEQRIIVPLDFQSLEYAKENSWAYLDPDDFFSIEEYLSIDKFVNDIEVGWWQSTYLLDKLTYNEIALGDLVFWELSLLLRKQIRAALAITKIVQHTKPSLIIGPKAVEYLINKLDHGNDAIDFEEIPVEHDLRDVDRITVPIDIAGKHFGITLSRGTYYKIKKLLDMVIAARAISHNRSVRKSKKDKPKVFMLDFDITRYRDVVFSLDDSLDVVLLNSRRPVVWNRAALSYLMTSDARFVQLEDYMTSESRQIISNAVKSVNHTLDEIWNTEQLEKIFVYHDLDLWPFLKDDLYVLLKDRFSTAITTIEGANQLFKQDAPDLILISTDDLQFERTLVRVSKKYKIKSAMILHGLYYSVFQEGIGYWPRTGMPQLAVDKFFVWGKTTAQLFSGPVYSLPKQSLDVIGNPRYDNLFAKRGATSTTGMILLGLSGLNPFFSVFGTNKATNRLKELVESVCEVTARLPDKKLIIKLHPADVMPFDIQRIMKEKNPNAIITQTSDTIELIRKCDVLISNESTILLEAMILRKPTIKWELFDGLTFSSAYTEYGASLAARSKEDLEKHLNGIMHDQRIIEDLMNNSERLLGDTLANQGHSSNVLLERILTMVRSNN